MASKASRTCSPCLNREKCETRKLAFLLTQFFVLHRPSESLTFLKQEFTFASYRELMLVHFLRHLLAEGFYNQCAFNEELQSALGIAVDQQPAKVKLSGIEKRLTKASARSLPLRPWFNSLIPRAQSPNSSTAKGQSKDLRRDRQRKSDMISYDTQFE